MAAFFRTWPARSLADLGKTACRPFWTAFLSRWRPLASSAAGTGLVSSLYAIDEAPPFSAADPLRPLASGPRIAQICRFSLAGASQPGRFPADSGRRFVYRVLFVADHPGAQRHAEGPVCAATWLDLSSRHLRPTLAEFT